MRSKPLKPLSTEVEALLQHERSLERVPPELAARVLARARGSGCSVQPVWALAR
jgi:hypothetical protein